MNRTQNQKPLWKGTNGNAKLCVLWAFLCFLFGAAFPPLLFVSVVLMVSAVLGWLFASYTITPTVIIDKGIFRRDVIHFSDIRTIKRRMFTTRINTGDTKAHEVKLVWLPAKALDLIDDLAAQSKR